MSNSTKVVTPIARIQGVIAEIHPAVADATTRLGEENARLRKQLAMLTVENQRLSEQLVAAEERGAGLVKLHVSNRRRLDEAADRRDALDAIQEIIVSVVGCEEYAILEADPDGVGLELVASLGIDAARLGGPSAGVIADVVESGTAFFAPIRRTLSGAVTDSGDSVAACVPLCASGGRVVGAIVLYDLPPHKPALDRLDRSLLELLSVEAARSLLFASSRTASAEVDAGGADSSFH